MDIPAFIRLQRRTRGLKQDELGDLIGVGQATISKWESGKDTPSLANLQAIASWTGTTVEQLTGSQLNPVLGLQALKVVGVVQAGHWVEEIEFSDDLQFEISVPPSGKFPAAKRFGLLVRGPSMNQIYPEGAILICVSVYDIERDPRPPERVICRRKRGDLYEVTVKEFAIDDNGRRWLVPKSTDFQFQQAINLDDPDGADEIEITAVVIGSYRPE